MPALRRSPGAGFSFGSRAPGMLSIESPISAITSATFSGGTPMISSTFFSSITRSFFAGFSMRTRPPTSCIRSLSLVTMKTSRSSLRGLARERADHVVRFVAGIFEDGEAHRLAVAPHERNLHGKVVRHRRALRFVGGEKLVAERWARRTSNTTAT